jgi:chitinase
MKFPPSLPILSLGVIGALSAPTRFAPRDLLLDGNTMVTFWGQGSSAITLMSVCTDPSFDVVLLSFLTTLSPPSLNLAGHTGPASAAQLAAGFPNLVDASALGTAVTTCQANGKKVMVSFGGDARVSSPNFASLADAEQGAQDVWDLFLGGSGQTAARPFGPTVILDGFDFDNESGDASYYIEFTQALKKLMTTSKVNRKYYLSADPMCVMTGDQGTGGGSYIPDDLLKELDFVNVQFYNNADQGVGSEGFDQNIKDWAAKITNFAPNAKMMVGFPGSSTAGSNYLAPSAISTLLQSVQGMGFPNLGGVAIWDAERSMLNSNYQTAVKSALAAST